jgi:PhnB protein
MTIQAATPYLILNGKAEQAIELYQRALGAVTEGLQRFGDVDQSCAAAQKHLVMHAALRVGKALLMLSDGSGDEGAVAKGGQVSVALDFDDADEMRRSFAALAAKGKVIEPIMNAPWGALFGIVQDELGISWMGNCANKPS